MTGVWLAERLNRVLSFEGAPLEQVIVTRELKHHHSRIIFFQAIYASDFVHGYPVRWVAKIRADGEGVAEGAFYKRAQTNGCSSSLPEWGGFIELDEGVSLLLLKNLQHDYRLLVSAEQVLGQGLWRPSSDVINNAVTELARFHASWWQNYQLKQYPDVFSRGGWWGRNEHFASDHKSRKQQVSQLKASQNLSSSLIRLLDQSIETLPLMLARLNSPALTCVHGDCYPWHFFISRSDKTLKLFDLEFVGCNSPAHDLVALLTFWRGDVQPLLQHYHQSLLSHGVENYSLEQLEEDFQLAIYGHVLTAVQDWQRGCGESLWKNKLSGLDSLKIAAIK